MKQEDDMSHSNISSKLNDSMSRYTVYVGAF